MNNIAWNPCVAAAGIPLEPAAADVSHSIVESKFDDHVASNGWHHTETNVAALGPEWNAIPGAVADCQLENGHGARMDATEASVSIVPGDSQVHEAGPLVGDGQAVEVHVASFTAVSPVIPHTVNGMTEDGGTVYRELQEEVLSVESGEHHAGTVHEDAAPLFGVLSPLSPIREVVESGSTPRPELLCASEVVQDHSNEGEGIYPECQVIGHDVMDPGIKVHDGMGMEACPPIMQTSRQRYLQIRDKFLSR